VTGFRKVRLRADKDAIFSEMLLHCPEGRFRGSPRKRHRRILHAPVAQLDRAPDYESGGQEFESLRVRHSFPYKTGHSCRSRSAHHETSRRSRLSRMRNHRLRLDRSPSEDRRGERYRPSCCLLLHEAGERVDLLLSPARVRTRRGERSLQRGLRVIALVLMRRWGGSRRSSGRRTAN
jgi:hypothetical protein